MSRNAATKKTIATAGIARSTRQPQPAEGTSASAAQDTAELPTRAGRVTQDMHRPRRRAGDTSLT